MFHLHSSEGAGNPKLWFYCNCFVFHNKRHESNGNGVYANNMITQHFR